MFKKNIHEIIQKSIEFSKNFWYEGCPKNNMHCAYAWKNTGWNQVFLARSV